MVDAGKGASHGIDDGSSQHAEPAPIDCVELVELVTEYLEDCLDPRERRRLEHHLGQCPGCATYVEQMRITIRALGRLTPDSLPPGSLAPLLEVYRAYRAPGAKMPPGGSAGSAPEPEES